MELRWTGLLSVLALATSCGKKPESTPPSDSASKISKTDPVPLDVRFDSLWDAEPNEGKANLRTLLKASGQPLTRKTGLLDGYRLTIMSESGSLLHMERFTPGARSRFVFPDLNPDTYTVEVRHVRKAYTDWSEKGIAPDAGENLLMEVSLR